MNGDLFCYSYGYFENSKLYCTIDVKKNSNICLGDSGSSLMYYSNEKWFLFGITSYATALNGGNGCDNQSPSFFTKVPIYVNKETKISFEGNWKQADFFLQFLFSLYVQMVSPFF